MRKKLRIGIVGLGNISRVHLEGYSKCKNVDLVAFCDIIPERAKIALDKFGTSDAMVYSNYIEMFVQKTICMHLFAFVHLILVFMFSVKSQWLLHLRKQMIWLKQHGRMEKN